MSRLGSVRERLSGRYRASLRAEAAEIQAQLTAGPIDVAQMNERAHKLKGSGASFGFPDITAAATQVEKATPEALADAVEGLLALLIEHGASH
jgi:HPt (histidine-containing phosphotransfer) domain-containing protein